MAHITFNGNSDFLGYQASASWTAGGGIVSNNTIAKIASKKYSAKIFKENIDSKSFAEAAAYFIEHEDFARKSENKKVVENLNKEMDYKKRSDYMLQKFRAAFEEWDKPLSDTEMQAASAEIVALAARAAEAEKAKVKKAWESVAPKIKGIADEIIVPYRNRVYQQFDEYVKKCTAVVEQKNAEKQNLDLAKTAAASAASSGLYNIQTGQVMTEEQANASTSSKWLLPAGIGVTALGLYFALKG